MAQLLLRHPRHHGGLQHPLLKIRREDSIRKKSKSESKSDLLLLPPGHRHRPLLERKSRSGPTKPAFSSQTDFLLDFKSVACKCKRLKGFVQRFQAVSKLNVNIKKSSSLIIFS